MNKPKLTAVVFIGFVLVSAFAKDALAGESYVYEGTSGFATEFYLIGGQYTLYLNARRPIKGYNAPETRSCLFSGNLQRVWPTHDALSLGAGVTVSTLVPHKIGPAPLTMPAGLYRLFIAPLTDCDWHFVLESTNQNSAGVAPVRMFKISKGSAQLSTTASVIDNVEFFAQYRTEQDAKAPVSGVVHLIHGGKTVQTFPLQVSIDNVTKATVLHVSVRFEPSDKQYVGLNTAQFVVRIGSSEFESTGEFTLTQ